MSKTARENILQCSFCHKRQETVGKLVSSPSDKPRAYICNECVAVCAAIIEDDTEQALTGKAKEDDAVTSPARVFVLEHVHVKDDGEEDVKLIGLYSSRARAEEAVVRLISMPGFRDTPEGFSIGEYPIDQDGWAEGYTAIYCDSK